MLIVLFAYSEAKNPDINTAIRYIKLGNTYREAKDFDNSAKYISLGLKTISGAESFDARYWTAAAYEYLGYLYRDMAMFAESKSNFAKALDIYKKIIRQEDGSQSAMLSVINKLAELNNSELPLLKASAGFDGETASYSGRKLKDLPTGLPQDIKNLVLKDNRFKSIPDNLMALRGLEYLDLSDNRIKEISPAISNLTNLHYLDLSNNKIEEIPASLSALTNLRELNLESNKLKSLNFNLCALKELKILNLRDNRLNFQEVLNLVKCLPNTNILFDKYEKVEDDEDEETIE